MAVDRSRYGLMIAALGALTLAISVFLPWYGLSFTPAGIAFVQRLGDQFVSQFGNATLQDLVATHHASLSALAGHQIGALSAHQALKNLNIVLLALAGLATLDALIPLARAGASAPNGGGAAVLPLGAIAGLCVLYRIVHPPELAGGLMNVSLREGAWLGLLGSLAMIVGGLWPRRPSSRPATEDRVREAWRGLSGWTPEA